MKRITFILVLLMAAGVAKGQEIVTEFWHENGKYLEIHNVVETTDNCLIVECPMFEAFSSNPEFHGLMFYKLSMDGVLMDSLLLELYNPWRTLFERHPEHPDSHVFAYMEKAQDTLFFRMRTIDINLQLVGVTDLVIDSSPELFDDYTFDLFAEPFGDIIASYSIKDDHNGTFMTHFLRIGFDGTLKDRREVPEIRYFDNLLDSHTGIYSESPMKYCYWGSNRESNNNDNPPIRLYVLDSLFNILEEKRLYSYNGDYYSANWYNHFAPFGEQFYLHVNNYHKLNSNYYTVKSVLLEKRNRQHFVKAAALFGESIYYQPQAIRAIAMDSNTIYLSYMTNVGGSNHLVLLCLDGDLNIQWERHFLSEGMFHWATCMKMLQDGNLVICSFNYMNISNGISVVVIKDEYDRLEEHGIIIRPYTYYPNPAQDELRLYFSPDVTPTQIDLYDLQGRLVKTQRTGLESLNLQGIAAGTYTMRVTLQDGKVFSDKVIKE